MNGKLLSGALKAWVKKRESEIWQAQKAERGDTAHLLAYTVKLQEEVGELAEQVLARLGYQRKSKKFAHGNEALGEEIADVIIVSLFLAEAAGINIEKALAGKKKKVDARK